MEDRELTTALEIVSKLINGEEISRDEAGSRALYQEYSENARVFDITSEICKNMNISLYEYDNSLYASPGENNKVFGYTNDDLKRVIGVRLNKELYLCYFIIYNVITWFYKDSTTRTFNEYLKIQDIVSSVNASLSNIVNNFEIVDMDTVEEGSFKELALLWEDMPMVANVNTNVRASRGSKVGFVKMTLNFLIDQGLLTENNERYYPKKRMKALVTGYFEEYKGRLYDIMKGVENATH